MVAKSVLHRMRSHFRPLLKLTDRLLLVGILTDEDIRKLLNMVDPETWDPTFDRGTVFQVDKSTNIVHIFYRLQKAKMNTVKVL